KRMTVQESAVSSIGLSYMPWLWPTSSRMSFHSEQATWQALQPMQVDTSISLATSAFLSRTWGAGVSTLVAERLMMSWDCMDMGALRYTFSTLTRKALYSGVWVLASPIRGLRVLARKPLRVVPAKPQWQGMPKT